MIGNISFARILSRFTKKDITKSGSGNPGTMNMLRTNGFRFGLLTLLLDTLKGAIPALVGLFIFGYGTTNGTIALYVAGISVIVGHIYPVFYKFKGGKGIACTLGVFLVADPLWLMVFFVLGFIYLWFFDYGAFASLSIISALIIIEGIKNYGNIVISFLLFAIFILTWFAHRKNIVRMLIGKENKANLQKSIKKHFAKKRSEIKQEYKQEKQEIKQEYKQEVEKIKDDKEKVKKERKMYLSEKRIAKKRYEDRKQPYNYAGVLEAVLMKETENYKDNE